MRIQKLLQSAAMTLMAIAVEPALAHHSYAAFDQQKNVTIEGTVKEVQWTNPHIWIQVLAKDPATGAEVEWSIEGGSPNMLTRQGWTRTALKPGDKVVLVFHPSRSGSPYTGSLAHAVANGDRYFNGPDQPPPGNDKP